jgi:hypothetical protein
MTLKKNTADLRKSVGVKSGHHAPPIIALCCYAVCKHHDTKKIEGLFPIESARIGLGIAYQFLEDLAHHDPR